MIDINKIRIRSIEELISALQPLVVAEDIDENQGKSEMERMRTNVVAVLSFTHPYLADLPNDDELRYVLEEVRRECLVINGMISKLVVRKRLGRLDPVQYRRELLSQYYAMADTACRLCLMLSPDLGNELSSAF